MSQRQSMLFLTFFIIACFLFHYCQWNAFLTNYDYSLVLNGYWLNWWFCYKKINNSYGASWDSSCEKSWVTVQNQSVPVKKKSPKLKMLGPLCNQTVNLKTDSKTLYYSKMINWNLNLVLLFQGTTQRLKEICIAKH